MQRFHYDGVIRRYPGGPLVLLREVGCALNSGPILFTHPRGGLVFRKGRKKKNLSGWDLKLQQLINTALEML